ncbi:MAG: hypothetical protein QW409_02680, partial [Candidatus Aenigmatarchaeota archaeon]
NNMTGVCKPSESSYRVTDFEVKCIKEINKIFLVRKDNGAYIEIYPQCPSGYSFVCINDRDGKCVLSDASQICKNSETKCENDELFVCAGNRWTKVTFPCDECEYFVCKNDKTGTCAKLTTKCLNNKNILLKCVGGEKYWWEKVNITCENNQKFVCTNYTSGECLKMKDTKITIEVLDNGGDPYYGILRIVVNKLLTPKEFWENIRREEDTFLVGKGEKIEFEISDFLKFADIAINSEHTWTIKVTDPFGNVKVCKVNKDLRCRIGYEPADEIILEVLDVELPKDLKNVDPYSVREQFYIYLIDDWIINKYNTKYESYLKCMTSYLSKGETYRCKLYGSPYYGVRITTYAVRLNWVVRVTDPFGNVKVCKINYKNSCEINLNPLYEIFKNLREK